MFKRALVLCICVLMLTAVFPFCTQAEEVDGRIILYVATNGKDTGKGTIDSPFKTIMAARDAIRKLKKEGHNQANGFVVYLRGGEYALTDGVKFTKEDSGTQAAPITYRNYPGETVTILGGARLSGSSFQPVTDERILSRIVDSAARKKVVVADLHQLGFYNFGEAFWPGAYSYGFSEITYPKFTWINKPKAASPELFVNGEVQTVARYPNDGYMKVATLIDGGANPVMWADRNSHKESWVPPDERDPYDTFEFTPDSDRYLQWTEVPEGDALMYGFWVYDWADHTVPMKKVYPEEKKIESSIPNFYGLKSAGGRFYVFNLLEEIDKPGEYYLDRQNGLLYFYPPIDLTNAKISMSLLEDHLFEFTEASYINLKGLNMTAARASAVYIDNGSYNTVTDCEISYTADKAVYVVGSRANHNGVSGCYVHDVNGGIWLCGGERTELIPGENYAINNKVENYARITKGYNSAIELQGVANIAMYNEMCDGAHLAMQLSGNDHKIYFNDIHDVVKEQDDMGAIYTGRNWTFRGYEIKYNYIHNLKSTESKSIGIMGVYLDDRLSGVDIVGNVFEGIDGSAVMINGGRDNNVLNNLIVDCDDAFYFRALIPPDPESSTVTLESSLQLVPYQNELWSEKYPTLPNILNEQASWPWRNIVRNNVRYKSEEGRIAKAFLEAVGTEFEDNISVTAPGFYDAQKGIYLLQNNSDVFKKLPNFHQLPVTRMGTYSERAVNRVKNAVALAVSSPFSYSGGEMIMIDEENREVVPKIIDGVTYVPLRFVAEQWGMEVDFEESTGTITLSGNGESLILNLGEKEVIKNGEKREISAVAFAENGRTLIPLRAVSELFQKQVFWDDRGFITISSGDALFNTEADEELITYLHRTLSVY